MQYQQVTPPQPSVQVSYPLKLMQLAYLDVVHAQSAAHKYALIPPTPYTVLMSGFRIPAHSTVTQENLLLDGL